MISEAIKGNLLWAARDLRDAADNASAAYVSLADDNPLAGRALFTLLEKIRAALIYAEELEALAKDAQPSEAPSSEAQS